MPSKYRNVTSISINRVQRGGMLLDCGEGTFGQLNRRFGLVKVKEIVCGLACVWVSHIHADHHAGLPRYFSAAMFAKCRHSRVIFAAAFHAACHSKHAGAAAWK